jgi:hypothetical protein
MRNSQYVLYDGCQINGNGNYGVYIANGDGATDKCVYNVFSSCLISGNFRSGIFQDGSRSINNVLAGVVFQGNGTPNIKETYPTTAPLVRQGVSEFP